MAGSFYITCDNLTGASLAGTVNVTVQAINNFKGSVGMAYNLTGPASFTLTPASETLSIPRNGSVKRQVAIAYTGTPGISTFIAEGNDPTDGLTDTDTVQGDLR